jgi:thiol-disulfide isomerase/thioredoxin
MNKLGILLLLSTITFLSWRCETPVKGTTINGSIQNAANLQIFLDEVGIGNKTAVIAKTNIDPQGQFSMEFPEGLPASIYQLRVGAKKVHLITDGTEKAITLNGDLASLQMYNFELSGSKDSKIHQTMMQGLIARRFQPNDITNFIDTVSNPLLAAFVSYRALGNDPQYLDAQKKALARVQAQSPDSELSRMYAQYISQLEQQAAVMRASQVIKVGQPAPDISLPGPDGKSYSLSDLKGKVVLLDFWASWCGPCRRENPNVVKVYDRYKDQGFTVFSVSLDGMDSKTKSRLGNDPAAENNYIEQQRNRWIQAIEKDNLKWDYHVSDLKKWESAPARLYGVRGIPRTFLIDRDGNIAAINPRGAKNIEQELKKLL